MSHRLNLNQLLSFLDLLHIPVPREPCAYCRLLTLLDPDDLAAFGHAGGDKEWLVDRIEAARLSKWRDTRVKSPLVFPMTEPVLKYLGPLSAFLHHHSSPLVDRSESGGRLVAYLASLCHDDASSAAAAKCAGTMINASAALDASS
jgi:hypothetical protein